MNRLHRLRVLCAAIALLLLLPLSLSFFGLEADAAYAMPSQLDGTENIHLAYTFNCKASNYGAQTVSALLPYVAYLSTEGKILDTFMDSYLFLPYVTNAPSGGTLYRSGNPANADDWQGYVNEQFRSGVNLDALNTATKLVGDELGRELTSGVFLSSLYPVEGQSNFGTLGGKKLNFSSMSDRKAAVKWIVDEQLARYKAAGYDHLQLRGFYWFEENLSLGTNPAQERELVKYFNDYVHSLGYKTIWIPYYHATGWSEWRSCGFDVACMQPNTMWQSATNYNESQVTACANDANRYGMCMEMELDDYVFSYKYDRYVAYLRGGVKTGVYKAIKMYYDGGVTGTIYRACYSQEPRNRILYDLTYQYAKCTLTEEMLEDVYWKESLTSDDYTIVSVGKPYTATAPYTDTTLPYGNHSGTELTDGIIGTADNPYATEWHSFWKANQEADGGYAVTVDLGRTYKHLGYVGLQFERLIGSGIGLPDPITIEISTDGVTFTPLTTLTPASTVDKDVTWAEEETDEFSARYVRAKFNNKQEGTAFVFCAEFAIGQTKVQQLESWTDPHTYDKYKPVSRGKSYTASKAYTDSTAAYHDISGKELTDGIFGTSKDTLSTAWHSFWKGYQEPTGGYSVTIDLGKTMHELRYFGLLLGRDSPCGIDLPRDVDIWVSEDGVVFVPLAELSVPQVVHGVCWAQAETEGISARYVRATMEQYNSAFVFCSEFTVGQKEYLAGDMDGSGSLSAYDSTLLQQQLQNGVSDRTHADVNRDGDADQSDATLLLQWLSGMRVALPTE